MAKGRSLSRRVDYGEALSQSQSRVQRDFLGDARAEKLLVFVFQRSSSGKDVCKSRFAVPCRVVYGSGGGVSSVCSSLESWSHGFFASELSQEIVTVSLWEVLSVAFFSVVVCLRC